MTNLKNVLSAGLAAATLAAGGLPLFVGGALLLLPSLTELVVPRIRLGNVEVTQSEV